MHVTGSYKGLLVLVLSKGGLQLAQKPTFNMAPMPDDKNGGLPYFWLVSRR